MIKPEKCCEVGSYDHQIPMPINARREGIDLCVADIITALNAANICTTASCCGHGERDGIISLEDGRELMIEYPFYCKRCQSIRHKREKAKDRDICVGCEAEED